MSDTPAELSADYERGLAAGLERAKELVMGAPVLLYGQRTTEGPGTFPRIMDTATNPDGNPNFVTNSYALRDAILHWIEKDVASILPHYAPEDLGDSGVGEASGLGDGAER